MTRLSDLKDEAEKLLTIINYQDGFDENSLGPQTILDLITTIESLTSVLTDAVDGMEDMIAYVPEYFREKWEHDDYLSRAKSGLQVAVERWMSE